MLAVIYVGQRLLIPGQATPTYPVIYIVQRGDTLSTIAQRYDTTVAALMQVNKLRTETIYVGQRLTISVASDPNHPLIYHTVQRGDTLSAIGRHGNHRAGNSAVPQPARVSAAGAGWSEHAGGVDLF